MEAQALDQLLRGATRSRRLAKATAVESALRSVHLRDLSPNGNEALDGNMVHRLFAHRRGRIVRTISRSSLASHPRGLSSTVAERPSDPASPGCSGAQDRQVCQGL